MVHFSGLYCSLKMSKFFTGMGITCPVYLPDAACVQQMFLVLLYLLPVGKLNLDDLNVIFNHRQLHFSMLSQITASKWKAAFQHSLYYNWVLN